MKTAKQVLEMIDGHLEEIEGEAKEAAFNALGPEHIETEEYRRACAQVAEVSAVRRLRGEIAGRMGVA